MIRYRIEEPLLARAEDSTARCIVAQHAGLLVADPSFTLTAASRLAYDENRGTSAISDEMIEAKSGTNQSAASHTFIEFLGDHGKQPVSTAPAARPESR